MKLIKSAIIIILAALLFNEMGLFKPEVSEKIDKTVENTKEKINEIKYKDKNLTDMSLKELSGHITKDITDLKEDIITENGVKFKSKGLSVNITPKEDIILQAKVSPKEGKSVELIEKLISNLIKKDFKVPEKHLDKTNFTIKIEKIKDEYKIDID